MRAIAFETTGNVTDAQDLTQDVFLRAFEKLSSLRDTTRFGPWVIGIVRLAGKQWRRTRARDRHRLVGEVSVDTFETDSSPALSHGQLHAAMIELDESERMALHLFYFDDQPAQQARLLMGLSLSGFYRVLERARAKIKVRICENEETKP
ncbi:MAG: sigma-70 family RNA polymerase sigma factor [Planctomycetes bacterium]|nr:sigma-70 family RNA polymerase sigma factor [Planctomycetota bacterium]